MKGTLDKTDDKDEGYVVEVAIPWRAYAFGTPAEHGGDASPKNGDTWRMNFYAMQDNGGVAWSPILGQGNFHRASRFGKVRFTSDNPAPAAADAGAPATDAGSTDAGRAAAKDAGPPAKKK